MVQNGTHPIFTQCSPYFLDNSSGGSFTNNTKEEAWNLLETIAKNTGHQDLDKGNEPYLDY